MVEQLALAIIGTEEVLEAPKDLYIPPHALRVFLESFEGPLDLLLYLIRKQNIDILAINVNEITRQYMEYIAAMESLHFELAAEYLVMAATLAEIKSRMLLPRSNVNAENEEDPRAALIRRLQEYERYKAAAIDIDELSRVGRDNEVAAVQYFEATDASFLPDVSIDELTLAFAEVLKRASMFESHQIKREELSTRERMSAVLTLLEKKAGQLVCFSQLFTVEEGRSGVVVSFLAILELIKERLLDIVQATSCSEIRVRLREGQGLSYEY